MAFTSAAKRTAGLLIAFAAWLGASSPAIAQTPPSVSIFYFPSGIVQGSTSNLYLQISNFDTSTLTGGTIGAGAFTYPAQVVNTGIITSNSCGGTPTATAGASSVSAAGITLAPSSSCILQVQVTTTTAGSYPTTFPPSAFSGSTGTNSSTSTSTLVSTSPLVVTNSLDSGAGSLRDAIGLANASCAGVHLISFNIPGPGPHRIRPLTGLPPIACASVTVDGTTQPGWAGNTDPSGANNASIQVELDGSLCSVCNGLVLQGAGDAVYGLAIYSFDNSGILSSNGGGNLIHGNYLGTDAGGMNAFGNARAGVEITGGQAMMGENLAEHRNLVSNNSIGVLVSGSGTATLEYNQIGGRRDGTAGNGNLGRGIFFNGVNFSSSAVNFNYVRYNGAAGIAVDAATFGRVTMSGNASYANGGIGIDIRDDGPTANDEAAPPYDTDGVQNYPVVTLVTHVGPDTVVSGYLKSVASSSTAYPTVIELYHNAAPTTKTEGELLIDSFSSGLDSTGVITFSRTIPGTWDNVSAATTVDSCGDGCYRSSEYSPSTAASNPLVVTNRSDSGSGSLRDAINFVNANCSGQMITFNIPGGGVQTIQPLSALPPITCDGTIINGFSQPLATPNGLAVGDDSNRLIEIDGGLAGNVDGFRVDAASVLIRGLIIDNFGAQAAVSVIKPAGATGIRVYGNMLGDPTGTRAKKNSVGVYVAPGATGLAIGTPAPADRNIISGNDLGVWMKSGDGSNIENNYIGTDAAGTSRSGNDTGIDTWAGVTNLAITGNVIAASLGDGILLTGTTSGAVRGNFIGTNQVGAPGLGNVANGVTLQAGVIAQVGGTGAADGNTIAFNAGSGVKVQGSAIPILRNSIHDNVGRGIDLGGVAPSIDHCDADGGANGLQNYPTITSAFLGGGTLTVTGTLDSVDLVTYRLELFSNLASDSADFRAGRVFIGFTPTVTSFPPTCSTPWSVSLPFAGAIGDVITSTVTDSAGNTSWFSGGVAVTAAPSAPGAPIIGTATAGNTQATVTFSPPASDGGSAITSYTVTSNPSLITASGSGSPITVTGLANGTSYTFTVTATNVIGTGPPSAPSNAVTPVAPPGSPSAPFIGAATAGNAQATVTFSPPASDGGSPVTSYTVSSSPSGITATGTGSPITVSGLVNGTTYTFTVVATNAVGTGPASAPSNAVTPTAPVPTITLTPPSLTFATRPVATTSPAQTVTLTNNGPGTLTITSIFVSGDFSFATACGVSLAPGATCTIDVTFTPLTAGPRTGSVLIGSNASGSPHSIALSGTGQFTGAPIIQVDPAVGDFAPQALGTTSAPALFVITNVGSTTLVFSEISVSGAGFTLLSTVTGTTYERCGASIASGAVCAVQVTFGATVPGTFTGRLRVAGNATNSPLDVSLVASAVVGTPARALSMASSFTFPDQAVGTQSAGHAFAITNTTGGTVALTGLDTDGDFSVSDTCATIAPHATCSPLLVFQPTAVGPRAGHLTVRTSTEAEPYGVALNGNGVFNPVPQIALSVTHFGFGNTLLGVPTATQVLVTNIGQVPVTIESVVASGDYFVAHSCGLTIVVGASCTLNVSFYPRMTGARAGGLVIRTNAAGSPHGVQLSGVGCALPSVVRARFGGLACGP